MIDESIEKEFTADVISSGRVTIPSYTLNDLNLTEGDRVRVKVSKKRYIWPLIYKDKETNQTEIILIEQNDPSSIPVMEKAIHILEDKNVKWAYVDNSGSAKWIVKPEPVETDQTNS